MKTFKITTKTGITNEVGYTGEILVGGEKVPVTYHECFGLEGVFWMLSDAATGCRIAPGPTRAQAKKIALAQIREIGPDLFFQAREKFMEIAYGGKTISEYDGKIVSKSKEAKYHAWVRRVRK